MKFNQIWSRRLGIVLLGLVATIEIAFSEVGKAQSTDSVVQITAESQGLSQVSYDQLPFFGTFWLASPGGSSGIILAPLPTPTFDPTLPIYNIVGNEYLVDGTGGQVLPARMATNATTATVAAAVQLETDVVSNLISQIQVAEAPSPMTMTAGSMMITAMDSGTSGPPVPRGSGGGTYSPDGGTNTPPGLSNTPPDYGTNLWIAQTAVMSGNLTGIGSNTFAGVTYTIQTVGNLLQAPNWQNEGTIVGSQNTNWTPWSVVQGTRTNLFVRLRSEFSSDGSGLPDWWEALNFGTNAVGPDAQDSAGDGYTIYQKYEMGVNPGTWVTPAAPQGFTASYNPSSGAITLNWQTSPGPVTGYTLQKIDDQTLGHSSFTFTAATTSYSDSIAGEVPVVYLAPQLSVDYALRAIYANGPSAPAYAAIESNAPPQASIVINQQGGISLILLNPPGDLSSVNVYRETDSGWVVNESLDSFYCLNDALFGLTEPQGTGYFSIPVSAVTNGICQIPNSQLPAYYNYELWVQLVHSNGNASAFTQVFEPNFGFVANMPFIDARQQLKDNLRFLLRAADWSQFAVATQGGTFMWPLANYIDSGFYGEGGNCDGLFREFLPIDANCYYKNFVFDPNNLTSDGFLNTGCVGNYWYVQGMGVFSYPAVLGFSWPCLDVPDLPSYYFDMANYLTNSQTVPNSVLGTNQTQWILQNDAGVGPLNGQLLPSGAYNNYGLPYVSVLAVYETNNQQVIETVYPGNSYPSNVTGVLYGQLAEPIFTNTGYYFARPSYDPMPEQASFIAPVVTPTIVQGVGTSQQIAGYAQLGIQNGFAGTYAYLGQYFAGAYLEDANGNATSTNTGILSPYGNFFATQPGAVALVTMPDIETGDQGTCSVYCVSLQLDKKHDGTMDTTFNGPDTTSPNSPYVLWANNNYDRWALDKADGTNYMDDVQADDCPYTPNVPTPDCNYRDVYGNRVIPCTRDLQDFFRLWVCGITPTLLTNLPVGSTVTLSWGDVGNPNSANPTIDLFQAVEVNGGIGYLTNEATATQQINPAYSSYIGRLGPGQSIQLNSSYFNGWAGNYFIMCGVSNGVGGLTLTIADGNSNTLAQSTSYIQIVDIKQMYERWTVGDNPNQVPLTNALPATEDLPMGASAFQYTPPTFANTPYVLYVHGWNMERWEKDRFAESAFKRLYWQGYHGRFGAFRWPTDYDFTGDFSQLASNPQEKDNYDNSENNAWQAGTGLLNKLKDLNAEYPGQVYVLAHSMGNVVTGEALRLAGNTQVVNTYVASQAAVPAHTYDATVANYSFEVNLGGVDVSFGPHTPNIYGNWFAGNNGGGAGLVISFYNVNDYALNRLHWQLNQLFKPDVLVASGGALWNYEYGGGTSDPVPWNYFFKTNIYNNARVNFDIVNSSTDHYEVFSHAAQSYTTALGATTGVNHHLSEALDLTSIWPSPDPLQNNYASHFWHSAEFRGDNPQQRNYWSELLGPDGFNINWPFP